MAGAGTGGTVTGTGRFLKEKNPKVQWWLWSRKVLRFSQEERKGRMALQGIGAGFVPEILDTQIYDEVFKVKEEEAYELPGC